MMRLSELVAYAAREYRIKEQFKWARFRGFSVLVHPKTDQWIALLMRRRDEDTGEMVELCDIKCGQQILDELADPYLSKPFRMRGEKWIGVRFGRSTEPEIVYQMLDDAFGIEEARVQEHVREGMNASRAERVAEVEYTTESESASASISGFEITLEQPPQTRAQYQETMLPFSSAERKSGAQEVPEKIEQMRKLYEYGSGSFWQKCRNFYIQGKFMEDYEDDAPFDREIPHYFPTYHELDVRHLRGYFSWRTQVRRGNYTPISNSLAYLYLYELINGIGTASVEDSLEKMQEFQTAYLDVGWGDAGIRTNLKRWMMELAVVNDLASEIVEKYLDASLRAFDEALIVLRDPKKHEDQAILNALCALVGDKLTASIVFKQHPQEAAHLFAQVWRTALAQYREEGKKLFRACFGSRSTLRWYPLGNALYDHWEKPKAVRYDLNPFRSYYERDGGWFQQSYQRLSFDKKKLLSLLRETDRRLRLYLKTGYPLKERDEDQWAAPFIEAVIEADRAEKVKAQKPEIHIRFADLEQIRQDAHITQESLLAEEQLHPISQPAQLESEHSQMQAQLPKGQLDVFMQMQQSVLPQQGAEETEHGSVDRFGLDFFHQQVLRALLSGESVQELLKGAHAMPEVVADALNEALYDEIGDTAVECSDGTILLIEDYRAEIAEIMGGK